jgi:hypothetical protein
MCCYTTKTNYVENQGEEKGERKLKNKFTSYVKLFCKK